MIDLEAERTVLVYALSGPLFAGRCGLRPDQFSDPDHRIVWRAVEQRAAMHPDDDPATFYVSVFEDVQARLGSLWRAQRVLARIHEQPSGMPPRTAVLMVRELAHRRLGLEAATEPVVARERGPIFVDMG